MANATMEVGGKKYKVISFHYGFHQNIDATGATVSDPRGGTVSISLESPKGDNSIFQWMIDAKGTKDAKITVYEHNDEGKIKTIDLKKASCVDYAESFDQGSKAGLSMAITVSAQEISVEGDTHKNVSGSN